MNNINMGNARQILQQLYQSVQANPAQFFRQLNMNIPQNIINNPYAILQNWLSTVRYSQQQVNQAYQIAQKMKQN